jgi:hypothetical protein
VQCRASDNIAGEDEADRGGTMKIGGSGGLGTSGAPAGPGKPHVPEVDFDRAPFLVIWETTRACDLACKH